MNLRRMELALLLILACLFTYAAAVSHEQDHLANGLLRLHVVANSDQMQDQEVKLAVRDRVLKYCQPLLHDAETREEVQHIIGDHLEDIAYAAQEELKSQGESRSIQVCLANEYYPTRKYEKFSLPAGDYLGLRVTIGAGQGRNWWCVVFPPLCTEVAETESSSAKTEKAKQLPKEYTIRFKTAEMVGALRHYFLDL